jgi:hypothetical protein
MCRMGFWERLLRALSFCIDPERDIPSFRILFLPATEYIKQAEH